MHFVTLDLVHKLELPQYELGVRNPHERVRAPNGQPKAGLWPANQPDTPGTAPGGRPTTTGDAPPPTRQRGHSPILQIPPLGRHLEAGCQLRLDGEPKQILPRVLKHWRDRAYNLPQVKRELGTST